MAVTERVMAQPAPWTCASRTIRRLKERIHQELLNRLNLDG